MPALIIAHSNCEAVKKRLTELRIYGINEIYIFVDGFIDHGSSERFLQRTSLIKMLKGESQVAKDLKVYFSETNLGVGIAVPRAVDWFFQQVDYGLVLEDDCSLLPFAKQVFDYCGANTSFIDSSVVCLSSPFSTLATDSNINPLELIESQLFTSWGWICHRKTWERVALREITWIEVSRAAFRVSSISRMENFWLFLSWTDIWLSLRKNQRKLWAFRFTILLILLNVRINYPNVKGVQHSPNGSGTNVKVLPEWDDQKKVFNRLLYTPNSNQSQNTASLDIYLVKHIQGASFISLITRFTYKLAKRVRIK
jgi:hypothetical protein